ncbi:MAG: tetratricopeptide repeat protein [Bacteroidota bacterium]
MDAETSPQSLPFDFQTDVLDASRERPILVDFWAPWCGPCRVLGPTLDRLAAEASDRWRLVKVNTDQEPALMQRYGVRGIPAVKLFADGRVTAEFTGALPEHTIRQWLAEHIPSPGRTHLQAGETAWAEGDRGRAAIAFQAALDDPEAASAPWADEARARLAQLIVFTDPARARQLIEDVFTTEAEAVRTLLAALDRDTSSLPEGSPARGPVVAALEALPGDIDAALGHLIDAIRADRYYDGDGARQLAVALFHALGEQNPVVKKHRPAFNMSLY